MSRLGAVALFLSGAACAQQPMIFVPDDPVDKVVSAIQAEGDAAVAFKADISEPENAKACVEKAVSEFGWIKKGYFSFLTITMMS